MATLHETPLAVCTLAELEAARRACLAARETYYAMSYTLEAAGDHAKAGWARGRAEECQGKLWDLAGALDARTQSAA